MTYLHPSLGMMIVAGFVFAAVLAMEPTAAIWMAHVLFARARAVQEARKTFARVRRCDIMIAEQEVTE